MQKNISVTDVQSVITIRKKETHKGSYGHILLIGGSTQFGGAIIMSALAAVNSGAGLVTVASIPENRTPLLVRVPEAMFVDYNDTSALINQIDSADVIVVGPGLSTQKDCLQLLTGILSRLERIYHSISNTAGNHISPRKTLILDATALTLLANNRTLIKIIESSEIQVILTPHQMEWQRLSKIPIAEQENAENLTKLKQFGKNTILVLKSSQTRVYDQSDTVWSLPIGNPAMATAGMGDTLTGMVAAFVAQFGYTTQVINAAVFLHSYIGDYLAKNRYVVLPTTISAKISEAMHSLSQKN